jgi:hypothetical protein
MVSNRLVPRWLKTVVVSDEEKAHEMRQVGIGKASASESLPTCREGSNGIKTGVSPRSRDESGGCPAYWPGGVRHVDDASPVCRVRMEQEKAFPDTAWPFEAGERECLKRRRAARD